MSCESNVCIECFKRGYILAINSPEAQLTLNTFSCIACKMPEYGNEGFQAHLEHLTRLVYSDVIFLLEIMKNSYCILFF